jgi:2,5-furandicarboxylate decarboxylase 1
MATKDLRQFMDLLSRKNELVTVREELSPRYEIPLLLRAIDYDRGKAALVRKVKGHTVPVLGNVLGTRKRLAMALGTTEEKLRAEYQRRREKPISPVLKSKGPVQEVVHENQIDIQSVLPILTHFERDVAPYITAGLVVSRDPESGLESVGIHRIQILGKDSLTISLHSPPLSDFLKKASERGESLPVAIVVGNDPLTFFASVIFAPRGVNKFDIAGGLAKSPIEMVPCKTVNLSVPAHAEFVLEGMVEPGARASDGPFGESTGYYITYESALTRIRAITHKRNPIYQGLVPFGGEETVLINFSWEADRLAGLQKEFPSVLAVHFVLRTLGLVAIIQMDRARDDRPKEALDALLKASPFTKVAIAVDEDISPQDFADIFWVLGSRFQPQNDVAIQSNTPGLAIDPSVLPGNVSSKIAIDATRPAKEKEKYARLEFPKATVRKLGKLIDKYT